MTFNVNTSPLAGKEGQFTTSRQIRERLYRELDNDVALKVEDNPGGGWIVSGRGELHLAIFIERLRREGYEFQVSQPQVIIKVIDGKKMTPYEKVFIEVPGHVPLNQVELNVKLEKEICKGAPFYVLGPLVTDIGMGYDHITAAIGGAIAGAAGADFLCYVTPSEHIRLPTIEDVKEGVIVSKLAAHAADIAKGIKGAIDKDIKMAKCRKALDWNGQIALSLNPDKVKAWRAEVPPTETEVCSMCGEFCAIRTVERALRKG